MKINVQRLIPILFFLFITVSSYGQVFTQTFVDRCTGDVQVVTANFVNGSATVGFYNKVRTFTYQEFVNGQLHSWLIETYSWWNSLSPCSTATSQAQQAQQTATNATNAATNATNAATNASNAATTATQNTTTNVTNNTATTNTTANTNSTQNTNSGNNSTSGTNQSSTSNNTSGSSQSNDTSGSGGSQGNNNDTSGSSNSNEGSSGGEGSSQENNSNESSGGGETSDQGGDGENNSGDTENGSNGEEDKGGESDSKSEEQSEDESVKEEKKEEEKKEEEKKEEEEKSEEDSEESDSDKDEKEEKKKKKKEMLPIQLRADALSNQSLLGTYDFVTSIGATQSSLFGDETYGLNGMIWSNLRQFSLNGSYTKVHLKQVNISELNHDTHKHYAEGSEVTSNDPITKPVIKVSTITSLSFGYMYNYGVGNIVVSLNKLKPMEKWGVVGAGVMMTNTVDNKAYQQTSIGYNLLYTNTINVTPRIQYSPALIWTQTPYSSKIEYTHPPFKFYANNMLKGSEIGGIVILSNSFTVQLTRRFSFNTGWTLIKFTDPSIPTLNSFMIGAKLPF